MIHYNRVLLRYPMTDDYLCPITDAYCPITDVYCPITDAYCPITDAVEFEKCLFFKKSQFMVLFLTFPVLYIQFSIE